MCSTEPKRVVLDSKEEMNEYISNYEKETQSHFIVWSKDKPFGEQDCAPHPKSLVYWESKEGTLINFTGRPFIRIGRKILVCHLGPDKNKVQKESNRLRSMSDSEKKRRVIKATKKRNCPARIYCSHVIEFLNECVQISSNTKSRRRMASVKLRELLENGTAKYQNRFHVMAAHPDSHKHDSPPIDTSIPRDINVFTHNSIRELAGAVELIVEENAKESDCENEYENYSVYYEGFPDEVVEHDKDLNAEMPVEIPKGTGLKRRLIASSCTEKLRKLQSLLPSLRTNTVAALDATMDTLLSHVQEMPMQRKQSLTSITELPSKKERYGVKKKATSKIVSTALYHDQTVNVSVSNSSISGRYKTQHLAFADNELPLTPQRSTQMTTSSSTMTSSHHIIQSPVSQGEQVYPEQQMEQPNYPTHTVCVTRIFDCPLTDEQQQ